MVERAWSKRIVNGHVELNPDDPENWRKYNQDTDEIRMGDANCPGGFNVGLAQLEYIRSHRATEKHPSRPPSPLNPTADDEIWE